MSEWQPIETAPRDGTVVIVGLADGSKIWRVSDGDEEEMLKNVTGPLAAAPTPTAPHRGKGPKGPRLDWKRRGK